MYFKYVRAGTYTQKEEINNERKNQSILRGESSCIIWTGLFITMKARHIRFKIRYSAERRGLLSRGTVR